MLKDLCAKFGSDKGGAHAYIPIYELLMAPRRLDPISILEIGVLFGNSLRMWEAYFPNGAIWGIDDFSQKDGHGFFDFKPVVAADVAASLARHPRIRLLVEDCEKADRVRAQIGDARFDIIIDDGSHRLQQQLGNLSTFLPLLRESGLYIVEDVQTDGEGHALIELIARIAPGRRAHMLPLNVAKKSDDRLVVVMPS